MRGIRRGIAGLLLLALAGCASNFFYQPDRVLYDTPARAGLKYEQVVFPSRDGTRLVGWFIPAAGYRSEERRVGKEWSCGKVTSYIVKKVKGRVNGEMRSERWSKYR